MITEIISMKKNKFIVTYREPFFNNLKNKIFSIEFFAEEFCRELAKPKSFKVKEIKLKKPTGEIIYF